MDSNNYIEYKLNKYITKTIINPSNILNYLDKFNQYSKLKKYHNKLYFLNSNDDKYQTYLQKYYYYLNGGKPKGEDEKRKEERKKVHKNLMKADESHIKAGIELTKAETIYLAQELIIRLNNIRSEYNKKELDKEIEKEKLSNEAYKKDNSKKEIKEGLKQISKFAKIIFEKKDDGKVKDARAQIDTIHEKINTALNKVHSIESNYLYYKILAKYEKNHHGLISKLTKSLESELKKYDRIKNNKKKVFTEKIEAYKKTLEEFNSYSQNKLNEQPITPPAASLPEAATTAVEATVPSVAEATAEATTEATT